MPINLKILSQPIFIFLFSISFLPLTQITEVEAQFSNKIRKLPTAPSIKKPPAGKLTNKQKKKLLGKMPTWNFDSPMEKLIVEINHKVLEEWNTTREVNEIASSIINDTRGAGHKRLTLKIIHLADLISHNIGCDAPSMYGNQDRFCEVTHDNYVDMLTSHFEAPFILSYRTHKQLLHCGVEPNDIDLGAVSRRERRGFRSHDDISATPLSLKLRSMGNNFGKCFCKFGSRQGTHPSAGYENIVPNDFSGVCPL